MRTSAVSSLFRGRRLPPSEPSAQRQQATRLTVAAPERPTADFPDEIHFPIGELRARRETLGWTRLELANKCGLSESTIRNLETGRHSPTAQTLAAIATALVSSRRHAASDFHRLAPASIVDEVPGRQDVYCFGVDDTLSLRERLVAVLSGQGGYVQPSLVLSDPACALKFVQYRNRHDPIVWRTVWQDVGRVLRSHAGRRPLDVWALGCADAAAELSLLEWLLASGIEQLRVLLLEQSAPLLGAAMRKARALHREQPWIHVAGLHAGLMEIPQYRLWPNDRRQLFTLLWPQLDPLASETRQLRQALWHARPRDLFLLGFELASAMPQSRPSSLLQPPASCPARQPSPLLEQLIETLFRPHLKEDERLQLSSAIDLTSGVSGSSFAVELLAEIASARRPLRRFSAWRSSRYEPQALAHSLKQDGWQLLAEWQDGKQVPATGLHLYERAQGEESCASEARPSFGSRYRVATVDRSTLDVTSPWTVSLPSPGERCPPGGRRDVTLCRAIERARCHAVPRRPRSLTCSVGERIAKLAHLLLQR